MTVSGSANLHHQANQEALHSDAISPEARPEHTTHPVLDESGAVQQQVDKLQPAPQHESSPFQQLPTGSQHGKQQQQDKISVDQRPAAAQGQTADLQAQHVSSTPTPAIFGVATGQHSGGNVSAQHATGTVIPGVQSLTAPQTDILLQVAEWLQQGGAVVLCSRPRIPVAHATSTDKEFHVSPRPPKLHESQAAGIPCQDKLNGIVSAARATPGSSQVLPEGTADAEAIPMSESGLAARKRKREDHPNPARCQRFCARAYDATQTISRVLVALWIYYVSQNWFKEHTQ